MPRRLLRWAPIARAALQPLSIFSVELAFFKAPAGDFGVLLRLPFPGAITLSFAPDAGEKERKGVGAPCPLRVIRRHYRPPGSCPLYPQQQKWLNRVPTSEKGQCRKW